MYVSVHILTLTSIVTLLLVFNLSLAPFDIFWTLEAVQLLTLLSFDLCKPARIFPWYLRLCNFPLVLGSAYTCIQLEIPGPQQKAGPAHKLKPLSRNPLHPEP